jgi:methylglutaconyl-CoA hydratase
MESLKQFTSPEGVTTLTLNRPEKRNALDGQLISTLHHALTTLAHDTHTRMVIITGNGDHFCAGADISWMEKFAQASYEENKVDAEQLADMLYQLYMFPKPTLVLAHGATLGGGLGLVAAADFSLAAENATFGFPEVKMGLIPAVISPYVIMAMGERAAHYYFLTGIRFHVIEAQRLGLIQQITANDLLIEAGTALAQTLLQNAPEAMGSAKQLIRQVSSVKVSEALVEDTAAQLATRRVSPEAQEGLRAFLEKRTPKWR